MEGGSTTAVLAQDTAVDKSKKKMAERVARSPVRLCIRDWKIYYYRRLEYDFLRLCLASFFFPSFSPSLLRYVSLLRIASSVQQSSAPRQQVCVYFLCHLYSALSQNSACCICSIFFVFLVILGRRVCYALVHGTLTFDLPTSIISPLFIWVFLCFSP